MHKVFQRLGFRTESNRISHMCLLFSLKGISTEGKGKSDEQFVYWIAGSKYLTSVNKAPKVNASCREDRAKKRERKEPKEREKK